MTIPEFCQSETKIKFPRKWAMPNHRTFNIKPIKEFIRKNTIAGKELDLFPYPYKEDALQMIKKVPDNSIWLVKYDPIYSRRQQNEMYKIKGTNYKSHPEYFADLETEIFRVVCPNGRVLKFGWNSKRIPGFEMIDGLLVAHGGQHNDTICTAWQKIQGVLT